MNLAAILILPYTLQAFSTALSAFYQALKSESWFSLATLVNRPAIAILPIASELQVCLVGIAIEWIVAVGYDGVVLVVPLGI
jgi:hypothetical protein